MVLVQALKQNCISELFLMRKMTPADTSFRHRKGAVLLCLFGAAAALDNPPHELLGWPPAPARVAGNSLRRPQADTALRVVLELRDRGATGSAARRALATLQSGQQLLEQRLVVVS